MKTDISFLPENKQQELATITILLREMCDDIEMVVLYGSYARNEYKEAKDLEPDRWSGHVSDYDILVVTGKQETAQNRKLLSQMQCTCQDKGLSATVRITLFDLQELNIRLAEEQYFYSDVKKEGIVLFNEKEHTLAEKRELTNEEKSRIAKDHFDERFDMATQFYDDGIHCRKQGRYKKALFELHQATEGCFKCTLLVFINKCPQEHFLSILSKYAARAVPALKDFFPQETTEELERFTLLDNSYIGSRYIRDFFVEKEDIEYLAPLVEKLLQVTKDECEEKILILAGDDKS